jgi:hypothetical protein
MIIIEGEGFKMEQVKNSPFFDLYILTANHEATEKERLDLKLEGYGMTFEACMKRIISFRLSQLDIICSVSEYIDLYENEVKKVLKLLRHENPGE